MPIMKMCDKKQHYYDSERYSSCPYCKQGVNSVSSSPVNPMPNTNPITPINPMPNTNAANNFTPPRGNGNLGKLHQKTITTGSNENSEPFVVGWLVCTEGEDCGKDFRIHAENNYIGRDNPECDINLNDMHISFKHFVINYDTVNDEFSIYMDGGKNTVYVNNKPLRGGTIILNKADKIKIGKTLLVFIPLETSIVSWKWDY